MSGKKIWVVVYKKDGTIEGAWSNKSILLKIYRSLGYQCYDGYFLAESRKDFENGYGYTIRETILDKVTEVA